MWAEASPIVELCCQCTAVLQVQHLLLFLLVMHTICGMLQAHKENSPECLTVTHYIDLKEKGLVLMRGEYDRDVLVSMTGEPINNNFTPLLSCAELNTADSQSILKDKPKMQ